MPEKRCVWGAVFPPKDPEMLPGIMDFMKYQEILNENLVVSARKLNNESWLDVLAGKPSKTHIHKNYSVITQSGF